MKKKVVIGLSIFCVVFISGYIYIVASIERITSSQDDLIMLHRVEMLRERLLIQVKRVQADLHLMNTRHARGVDTVVDHVRSLETSADSCFDCHHAQHVVRELVGLRSRIEDYKDRLSRVFTIRANAMRLKEEEDVAFETGEELIAKVNKMVEMTRSALDKKTLFSRKSVAEAKKILFIIAAFGPILGIGLAVFLIRGFTGPVDALLKATRRLRSGDLDYRIVALSDEFGEVGESFNDMAGSLKEQMHKMQRVEQMTVVAQMATMLAHEIKNPLAGIKASIQLLHEELDLSQEDKHLLIQVIGEVRRIELLLTSLLSFAKPSKPNFMSVDVNTVLSETINVSFQYPKDIELVKDFDYQLPTMIADAMQLQQVFLNLLLNATEAMPDGGILTIKTYNSGSADSMNIEISDTGKGIDESSIEKIFEPFFTTKRKGTGLGLAITKRLVEQHGGTIGASRNSGGEPHSRLFFLLIKQWRDKEHEHHEREDSCR